MATGIYDFLDGLLSITRGPVRGEQKFIYPREHYHPIWATRGRVDHPRGEPATTNIPIPYVRKYLNKVNDYPGHWIQSDEYKLRFLNRKFANSLDNGNMTRQLNPGYKYRPFGNSQLDFNNGTMVHGRVHHSQRRAVNSQWYDYVRRNKRGISSGDYLR